MYQRTCRLRWTAGRGGVPPRVVTTIRRFTVTRPPPPWGVRRSSPGALESDEPAGRDRHTVRASRRLSEPVRKCSAASLMRGLGGREAADSEPAAALESSIFERRWAGQPPF
jgi:hypothetical protein